MPEVTSAARGISAPFWSTESTGFFVPGVDSIRRLGRFTIQMASADYFETLGTRILRGRGITDADRADGPLVAVVSEGMANAVWPGKDAIGQCIMLDSRSAPCRTVVGVAENIHQSSLTKAERLQFYLAIEQLRPEEAILFVRVRGNAADHAESVRRRLQPLMPGAGYLNVMPMRDILDPRQRSWQLGATMFVVFGGLALVLAAVGLYSVIAYAVAQRTQEIGVRMALGAAPAEVMKMVVRHGILLAAAGIAIGLGGAFALTHLLSTMVFGIGVMDAPTFAAAPLGIMVIVLMATFVPAFRATQISPVVALRYE